MATPQQAQQFVFEKLLELATYMQSEGFDFGWTGSLLVGVGAAWVAEHQDTQAMERCFAMAQAAIQKRKSTLQ